MIDEAFQQAVYTTLSNVPAGKVVSYGGLAKLAGYPGRARQVGRCLKQLPLGSKLPWHRVVGAQRKLAFSVGSEKYTEQRDKLLFEEVSFTGATISPENFIT